LALQLHGRDAIGVGGHQIGGPEPRGQRQLRVMHDGSGGDRGLATAAGALIGPGLGFQPPGFAPTAARADKPVWPARCDKIFRAGGFVAERCWNSSRERGKSVMAAPKSGCVRDPFLPRTGPLGYDIFCVPGCRGISLKMRSL